MRRNGMTKDELNDKITGDSHIEGVGGYRQIQARCDRNDEF